MTDKEWVQQKFPVAQIHKRFVDKVYEIWADGSQYPISHYLGEGTTEQEVWKNTRATIENAKHPKEVMGDLIKQLCG